MDPDTTVDRWFSSKPVLISVFLAVVTIAIGWSVQWPLQSILLGFLEVVLGVAIWAVRSVSQQIAEFRRGVEQYNSLLADVGELQDLSILDSLKLITTNLRRLRNERVLLNLMKAELQATAKRFREMSVSGTVIHWARKPPKDTLVIFEAYMNSLYQGCQYDSISNLAFWSPETLHRPRDFLDTNLAAVRQLGVKIRRVFLIAGTPSPTELRELKQHSRAAEGLGERMDVRVYQYTEYGESYSDYGNFGICRDENSQALLLEMHYECPGVPAGQQGAGPQPRPLFKAMEVVKDPARVRVHQHRFERAFGRSQPLDEYLRSLEGDDRTGAAEPARRRVTA